MNDKDKKELLIPKELYETLKYYTEKQDQEGIANTINEILKSQMFQMLNDYPIPHQWCLHLRQIVYPNWSKQTGNMYKSYQCINCKKYL